MHFPQGMVADVGQSFLRAVKEHNNRRKGTHVQALMKLVHMGDDLEDIPAAQFHRPKSSQEIKRRRGSSTSADADTQSGSAALAEDQDAQDMSDDSDDDSRFPPPSRRFCVRFGSVRFDLNARFE